MESVSGKKLSVAGIVRKAALGLVATAAVGAACTPTATYQCSYTTSGSTASIAFDGVRGYSENLLVDDQWVATVDGLNTYSATVSQGSVVSVRLRGNGYDGPDGYATVVCDNAGATPSTLAPLEPADGKVLWGAWPASGATGLTSGSNAVGAFEGATGTSLDIVQTFAPPHDAEWKLDYLNWIVSQDKIPLITWKVGPSEWPDAGQNAGQRVVDGEFDAQIRARAQEAKQINGPFFSRLFHEMDGGYGARYDMTPAIFEQYWRHIHGIFESEGVTNAVWVWTPAVFEANKGEAAWYPGDDVVDWIGQDPYLWVGVGIDNPRCATDPYRTLDQRAGNDFWNFAAQHPDKPIMFAEWGVGSRPGTDIRKDYFNSVDQTVANHPKLKALVYYNSNPGESCSWKVQDGYDFTGGLAAYGQMANNPARQVDVVDLVNNYQ